MRHILAAGVAALLISAAHADDMPASPAGNWLTEDRDAVIAIGPCGLEMCGQIAGIPLAIPNEPIPKDKNGKSQCHLTIIYGATPDDTGWNARIIDPRSGSIYRVRMQLDAQGRLRVRGYLGITLFGRTQVWTPFTAPLPANCRLPGKL